jgi:hypothetical protein
VKFVAWNMRSLYRSSPLTTTTRELARYKLDTVGIHEVRRDKGGTLKPGDYILFYEKVNKNYQMGKGVFVHDGLVSAVVSVELVSDTVSCIGLRGRWCKIIVLSVHAPTEEKIDGSKTVFVRN